MRKLMAGIVALLLIQSGLAEILITAQDYAVDSDVVLETAVKEVKSTPRDTVNVIGDSIKYVSDETVTAAKGVAAVFKSDPVEKAERAAALETAGAWDSSNDIQFRSYKVTDEVGEELTQGADVPSGSAVDASGFFTGIEFPEGASAWYRPDFNRLFVRNTLAGILSIEDILAEQHSAVRDLLGKQVEIETKFIEVNQSTLNELGFDWNLDSAKHLFGDVSVDPQSLFSAGLRAATGPAGALGTTATTLSDFMVLERAGQALNWTLVINAMEQANDTDVLSAPSIVTRDGNTASILVGEERMVSTSFDASQSESSLFIEHELESQLMGVQLEVTPEIRSDDLLDLELKPKVIDLIGYDNYLVHPSFDLKAGAGGNNYVFGKSLPELTARMPYYRLREMETQVTVADGSTVGMGGLIYDKLETFRDKVPVLGSIPLVGRLFRSEGERSVKRNLMIFVTATQVDVNGRRVSDLALNQ